MSILGVEMRKQLHGTDFRPEDKLLLAAFPAKLASLKTVSKVDREQCLTYLMAINELMGDDPDYNAINEMVSGNGGSEMAESVQASSDPTLRRCTTCGKIDSVDEPLKICSGCRIDSVRYCSRECQTKGWSKHKKQCQQAVAARGK
jgi:hypothetical protein